MSNKKLPENATKTEGAELARRGRGEISTATAQECFFSMTGDLGLYV